MQVICAVLCFDVDGSLPDLRDITVLGSDGFHFADRTLGRASDPGSAAVSKCRIHLVAVDAVPGESSL